MARAWRKKGKRRKSSLGMWTVVSLGVLLAAYGAVLEHSRPHVEGDRLRLDTFVNLVANGRIKQARVLDEDAYVVGTYVKVPRGTVEPNSNESLTLGGTGGGHSGHGGMATGPAATTGTTVPAPEPAGSTRRQFAAPLLRANANSSGVVDLLVLAGVPTTIDQQVDKRLAGVTTMVLPALMMVVIFLYLIISYVRGTGLFNVRSGAKKLKAGDSKTTFADVAGQQSAVLELKEVRDFLADPERFRELGAIVPKGILLFGPPGCGKTLLARAVAGEAGASFFSISGADFVELYVGVGASRVRDLFAEAREHAPAIVFIDEIDAVGRRRRGGGAGASGSHEEQEQALNQILTELDGFSPLDGIIVIGATNRPDILDPALLRPGRFDRTIGLERPDEAGRLEILKVHADGKPLAADIDLAAIAARSVGLSGADLANVMNEGALLAARGGRTTISQEDLRVSLLRVLEAPERQKRLSMRDRSFGRATGGDDKVSFADIAGVDEAIQELGEVREYLLDPERFVDMGAKPPKGFLLSGPPGCGKTLLARAVAVEANATFFAVAATEFVEVFVGEGAARVRDLFAEARAGAPSVVFIDEIDAVGSRRGSSADGNREREQTLNQILVELDGFDARTGVTVLAATNRPEILDEALIRPGRFDRTIIINLPDRAARRSIIDVHTRGKRLGPDVDLDELASMTQGYSGADLANVLNEAALLAARNRLEAVPMTLVVEAVERVGLGVARAQRLTEQDRQVVAYHEVGHALVGRALPGGRRPRRLTIVARGHSLGATWGLGEEDRSVYPRSVLIDQMAGLLGGRAAEELVFGEPASGASGDLKRVAELARRMVCDYAMSDAIGPVAYPNGAGEAPPDAAAAKAIDAEVRKLIDEAYSRARGVLVASRDAMDRCAQALIEAESLSGEELDEIAGPVPKPAPAKMAAPL